MIESSNEMSLWAPILCFCFSPSKLCGRSSDAPVSNKKLRSNVSGLGCKQRDTTFHIFRRKCFFFFFFKTIAGKLDLNHFPVYFGLSFLTSSSETLFFDAVVTFNDAIKRKTNQTIPQSGEVKSLLQHTSPGIFWNPLRYNECACVIIDLSSGANKQGCDYSLYTYKVFLCLRVWEGWLHPLRNDPIQRQLYHSFIKNEKKTVKDNTHCYLHAQLGLGVHFGERHLRKQQKKYGSNIWNECRQNSFAFGLVRRPVPRTLTFGLGCDVASYLKQGSKGKALQQKESSAWVWRGQRGGDKATQDSGRNPKSHTGTDQSRRARNCTHCLNQGSPTPPKTVAQLKELC